MAEIHSKIFILTVFIIVQIPQIMDRGIVVQNSIITPIWLKDTAATTIPKLITKK